MCIIILIFCLNSIYAQQTVDDSDSKIRTVVIDPGHGGRDPGAMGEESKEKDIVLAIGLKLGNYIEENIPDVKVIYTRKTDEFIPLYRRAEIANENDADLFISLHANALTSPKPYGTETLVLGLHRSDENFEVAKRENSVILLEEDYTTRYENFDPNSLESYIVFSLMQNVYDHQSISFAGLVQNQFRERAKRKDRGVKRQGLLVLAQTSMPGVLIETGFVTNSNEEKYLMSDEGQDYIASAIFRAFREYKADIEAKSVTNSLAVKQPDPAVNYQPNDSIARENSDSLKVNDTASIGKSDVDIHEEIYFKVQIASSSKSELADPASFSGFNDLEEFKVGTIYKYAVGYKSNYAEIVEYSKWVRNRYPDAFIIAIKNGQIIPINEALTELGIN
jgi:N-acetylmuramoyl-L-alanine amidase